MNVHSRAHISSENKPPKWHVICTKFKRELIQRDTQFDFHFYAWSCWAFPEMKCVQQTLAKVSVSMWIKCLFEWLKFDYIWDVRIASFPFEEVVNWIRNAIRMSISSRLEHTHSHARTWTRTSTSTLFV